MHLRRGEPCNVRVSLALPMLLQTHLAEWAPGTWPSTLCEASRSVCEVSLEQPYRRILRGCDCSHFDDQN